MAAIQSLLRKKPNPLTLYSLLLLLHCSGLVSAADTPLQTREKIPLKAEIAPQIYSHTVGCVFGGARYDIDSEWHPVLEPYGVMYCLKCACDAVIKKGLLQQRGQVQCKRISRECPDVSNCAQTPVLPPNSCCKICPESEEDRLLSHVSPFGRQARHDPPAPSSYKIEHQASSTNTKTSSSLLTNSGTVTVLFSNAVNSTTDVIGKGYITLDQSILRITIELSNFGQLAIDLPSTEYSSDQSALSISKAKLRGKSGENFLESSNFTVENRDDASKICLVFRDASTHAEELKSDLVQLTLTTAEYPNGILTGFVKTITPQALETFSALLTGSSHRGYAATLSMGLILTSNTLAIRGSVVAPPNLDGKHPITVKIFRDRRLLFTEEQTIAISRYGGEFHMSWTDLSTTSLKQLARGRLTARLILPDNIQLSGSITTFYQCGSLKALISGPDAVPSYDTIAVAVGQFVLTPSGRLDYKIEVKDIESKINEVVIETDRTSLIGSTRKITRLARDRNDISIVKVEGIYDKTDATEIQMLLEGKLFINIATRIRPISALRGQIVLVPTSQSEHILMHERDTGMASLAWCDTADCALTCDVLVPRAAVRRDASSQAYLDYWNQQQLLATFTETNLMEMTITRTEVQQIGSTLPTLRIVTKDSVLYGQASIPESCFDESSRHLLPAADQEAGARPGWVDMPLDLAHKCSYDKKIYSDGESWKPKDSNLACVTCSCKRNKAQCHPVICPAVECANPVTLPGECCPACPKATDDTSKTCFFPGDHRDHAVGTVWHPFMHPTGYFKCAICYCKTGGDGYDCKQTECPVPTCAEHLQETLPGECCPTCKAIHVLPPIIRHNTDLTIMQGDSDSYSSCKVGDKQYANGETFNPRIGAFGMYGNVLCTCRNGKVECNPIECDCSKKISRKNRCCMKQCGFTESDMIRKRRRKEKNRRKDTIC